MKKTIALVLVLITLLGLSMTGCGSSDDGLEMYDSYMIDDRTVVAKFKNESNKTLTYVSGSLYLYTGSSTNQNAIKSPSFTWTGTCEPGGIFKVEVTVSNPPAGLSNEVNRIGHWISEYR